MLVVDKKERFAVDCVCAEISTIVDQLRKADTNSISHLGSSSNDDTADEASDSPMTPVSISSNGNPTSKHETESDILEWHLDDGCE